MPEGGDGRLLVTDAGNHMSFSYGGGFRGFSTTVFLRVGPVVRCGLPLEPGYRPYSYVVVPVGTKDGMT
jgi:hypothetical protein